VNVKNFWKSADSEENGTTDVLGVIQQAKYGSFRALIQGTFLDRGCQMHKP